jgi:tetratricopeptide (TPR) repeat protein
MKRVTFLILFVLFVVVWPVRSQTPSTAVDYFNRGAERQKAGDLDGAIANYNKAIEIDPRYAAAYNNRGGERQAKGDHDGAIADYTKAIEINPRFALAYYNRGDALKAKGDLEGTISDYNKYIELEPRDPDGYNALAWLLATSNREAIRDGKKAVEYARKVAELTKWEDANVLDTLAVAYAEEGNFDEAIKWENKALSFPEFAKTSGDEARKHLQLYAERKPYHEPQPK